MKYRIVILIAMLWASCLSGEQWTVQTSNSKLVFETVVNLDQSNLEVMTDGGPVILALEDIFWIREGSRLDHPASPWILVSIGTLGGLSLAVAANEGDLSSDTGSKAVTASVLGGLMSTGLGLYYYMRHESRATHHLTGMLPEEKYLRLKQLFDFSTA